MVRIRANLIRFSSTNNSRKYTTIIINSDNINYVNTNDVAPSSSYFITVAA